MKDKEGYLGEEKKGLPTRNKRAWPTTGISSSSLAHIEYVVKYPEITDAMLESLWLECMEAGGCCECGGGGAGQPMATAS